MFSPHMHDSSEREGPAESAGRRAWRRRGARAFTLIELMVVVLIIGILAAIAVPGIARRIDNNQAREVAQEITTIYRGARMRAAGRGSAVLVRYIHSSRTFEVREAIVGATAASASFGDDACSALPESGCNPVARWDATDERNILIEQHSYPTGGEFDVQLTTPSGNNQNYDVCYTPIGVSRDRDATAATNPFGSMTNPLTVDVKLSNGNGIERRVVVTPNGQGRVVVP